MNLKAKKDEDLFQDGCSGNQLAFFELYSRHTVAMFKRVKFKYFFAESIIEDILNDVWLKMWEACGNPGPSENFGGYFLVTLNHRCCDFLRKNKTHNKYFQPNQLGSDEDPLEVEEITPDQKIPSMEDMALADQQIEILERSLSKLSQEKKEAFMLFVEGRSIREVADIQKINVEAAKSRVRQARNRLKECLPKDLYEND